MRKVIQVTSGSISAGKVGQIMANGMTNGLHYGMSNQGRAGEVAEWRDRGIQAHSQVDSVAMKMFGKRDSRAGGCEL